MKNRIAVTMFAMFIMAFAAVSTNAQIKDFKQKKTPEERAKHRTEKMSKKLSLTSDQYNQVYSIMFSHAQKADEIRNSTDKQSRKDQMKSLFQSTDSQLQAVFSSEQLQKYNDMKEKRKNKKGKKKQKPNQE